MRGQEGKIPTQIVSACNFLLRMEEAAEQRNCREVLKKGAADLSLQETRHRKRILDGPDFRLSFLLLLLSPIMPSLPQCMIFTMNRLGGSRSLWVFLETGDIPHLSKCTAKGNT